MDTLIGVAGLIALSVITPGPNNLIVMRTASRSGLVGTLPAIGAVVLGGLALLIVIIAGTGTLFVAEPLLQLVITVGGCAYLAWLAIGLMIKRPNDNERSSSGKPGNGAGDLFVFQFLNPKGWVMLLTVTSAISTTSAIASFVQLAVLFVPLSLTGLFAWALFGSLITSWLARREVRLWFDRIMGGLLLAAAVLLLFEI